MTGRLPGTMPGPAPASNRDYRRRPTFPGEPASPNLRAVCFVTLIDDLFARARLDDGEGRADDVLAGLEDHDLIFTVGAVVSDSQVVIPLLREERQESRRADQERVADGGAHTPTRFLAVLDVDDARIRNADHLTGERLVRCAEGQDVFI